MTDENDERITRFALDAPEGQTVKTAETLTLTVSGDANTVLALFEAVVTFHQFAFGGEIASAKDENGNDIPFGPEILDPFDLGDTPAQ
jgi:hypothetical protein